MSQIVITIATMGGDIPRLTRAAESVRAYTGPHQIETVIVDNSQHGFEYERSPGQQIIRPGLNLGYVGALEYVRRHFPHDYFVCGQDDMVFKVGCLETLVARLEANPQWGAVSPVLVRDGVIPARTRGGVYVDEAHTTWKHFPFSDTPPGEFDIHAPLAYVSSAGCVFRGEAINQVGGFNLGLYPLLYVDVDVCAKLQSAGWQISLEPSAHISHTINGSTPRILGEVVAVQNRAIAEGGGANPDGKKIAPDPNVPVDEDILWEVAKRSSYLFLDVAAAAHRRIDELERSSLTVSSENRRSSASRFSLRGQLVRFLQAVSRSLMQFATRISR